MNKKILIDRLILLYNNLFAENVDVSLSDRHLLGNFFNIEARDLVYFLFEVENEFSVNIPQKYIINGDFCTLSKIADILIEQKYDSLN